MFHVKTDQPEYENKTFRLPVDLVERLSILAQRKNISLNKLVVQCCNYALDNLDETDA
ncbi:MAG: toxin-antitoxin system HicB family antitoxin [Ruthenibacterium sp.]